MATRRLRWQVAELPPLSADQNAYDATYEVRETIVECEVLHSDWNGDTIRRPDGKLMVLPRLPEGHPRLA